MYFILLEAKNQFEIGRLSGIFNKFINFHESCGEKWPKVCKTHKNASKHAKTLSYI